MHRADMSHLTKGFPMKKSVLAAVIALSFASGAAFAAAATANSKAIALEALHKHLLTSIQEMQNLSKANNYDTDGHAKKAEELLRKSEHELSLAIESAKKAK